MPISENMVQEIVQEVMAKMQIADAPTGKHGIFKEMNDAIEAAKKSQLIVKEMSMDQREKIITCIRKKIKENAEVMAEHEPEPTDGFYRLDGLHGVSAGKEFRPAASLFYFSIGLDSLS